MMTPAFFEEAEQELLAGVDATFASRGLHAVHAGLVSPPPSPTSFSTISAQITYRGKLTSRRSLSEPRASDVHGVVALVVTRTSARALAPADIDTFSDAALSDALGELANMLLGRLKNALTVAHPHLTLRSDVPVVGLGSELPSCAWHRFHIDNAVLTVGFDIWCDDARALLCSMPPPSRNAPFVVREGEALFF